MLPLTRDITTFGMTSTAHAHLGKAIHFCNSTTLRHIADLITTRTGVKPVSGKHRHHYYWLLLSADGAASIAFYYNCSKEELIEFLRRKTRTIPVAGLSKDHYVKLLIQADNDAVFPFFRLPPELRTMVYKNLDGDEFCFSEILTTSRQVRKEATGIVDPSHNLELCYTGRGRRNLRTGSWVDVFTLRVLWPSVREVFTYSSPLDEPPSWFQRLLNSRSLRVRLWYTSSPTHLNHMLYELLGRASKLQELKILHWPHPHDDVTSTRTLGQFSAPLMWPVQTLGHVESTSFSVENCNLEIRYKITPVDRYNTFGHYLVMKRQVQALQKANFVHDDKDEELWTEFLAAANAVKEWWENFPDFVNEEVDNEFAGKVKAIEKLMEEEPIKSMLRALVKKHA